jgi:hypothetical protein
MIPAETIPGIGEGEDKWECCQGSEFKYDKFGIL